jgi:hypothetical protein
MDFSGWLSAVPFRTGNTTHEDGAPLEMMTARPSMQTDALPSLPRTSLKLEGAI